MVEPINETFPAKAVEGWSELNGPAGLVATLRALATDELFPKLLRVAEEASLKKRWPSLNPLSEIREAERNDRV